MVERIIPTEISALTWPLPGTLAGISPQTFEQALTMTLLANQFAYVYDHQAQALEFVSVGLAPLLGEVPPADELMPAWLFARLHPDDAASVMQAQAVVGAYLHERGRSQAPLPDFLFSLDYRLRHADGHYLRVLCQLLLLDRAPGPGPIWRSLFLFTDITHHKLTHEVRCHVNQPDFEVFAAARQPTFSTPDLTARERQVLALVLQGLTSRQIAHRLHLREGTVKTHRRNLLHKTVSSSFHGLLGHL